MGNGAHRCIGLFKSCSCIQVLSSAWPSHLDLDTDDTEQSRKIIASRCWKCKCKTLNFFNFLKNGFNVVRNCLMEAGTGFRVLSPIQVKMDVTFVDPALVVPCWWGQLTNLMAFYLLELLVGNEDRDTQYHQQVSLFFLKVIVTM